MKRYACFLVLAVAILMVIGCGSTAAASGKAVFAITDAAGDMGSVTSIRLTVDSVRVHSSGQGWVTISSDAQTFDLLKLRTEGTTQLLAQADVKADSYDMMELNVSKVMVVDASGEHEAKLPSNKLEVKGDLDVNANASATASFDFLADQSLHVTGQGEYILAPVVKLETRSDANAQVDSNNNVEISGGDVKTNAQVGMDIEGTTDVGLRISPDAVLSIAASGKVVQTKGHALVAATIKSVDTANGTVTLTTKAGTELALHVAGDTSLKVNGAVTKLADLSGQIGSEATVQYDAETKAVAKLAAGADVSAKADVGADIDISGVIKSVDTAAGTVTVTTKSGADVVLKVTPEAGISVGGLIGLGTKIGTSISATYDGTTGTTGEIDTEAEAEVTAKGTIKAVTPAEGTITITSQNGADSTLKVASDAKVMVNGSLKNLAELKGMIGADVTVTYSQQSMLASEVDAQGQASGGTSATVNGVIKAVNPVEGTVTIATSSGKDVVLNVTSASKIVADGTVSTLVDLATNIGAQVDASYDVQSNTAASLEAHGQANSSASTMVSGVIKAVNPLEGTVTIATSGGKDVVLNVTSASKIVADGTASTLVDLAAKVGAQIDASYYIQGNIATSLEAHGQASGDASATVSGTLKAVDAVQGTVTITTETGTDVVLKVTDNTIATLNGSATNVASLATNLGAQVTAKYNSQTNIVTSLDTQAQANATVTAAGILKVYNPLTNAVTIMIQTGEELVLTISSQTTVKINGNVTSVLNLPGKVGSQVTATYQVETNTLVTLDVTV